MISGPPDKSIEGHHGDRRFIFNWTHRNIGWALFGLGIATVYKGVVLFADSAKDEPALWLQAPAKELLLAWIIIGMAFGLIMEVAHIPAWEMPWGPFSHCDKFTAEPRWEQTLRSVLVAIYIAFSVATGIALIVVIADTTTSGEFAKPT